MAVCTNDTALAKDDIMNPKNVDGTECYYWDAPLRPAFLKEARSNILGKIKHNKFNKYRNNTDEKRGMRFGGDFYLTNSRHIYYGDKTALKHVLGDSSIRRIINFLKYRVVEMYNSKYGCDINETNVACDLISIIRAMPNQVNICFNQILTLYLSKYYGRFTNYRLKC